MVYCLVLLAPVAVMLEEYKKHERTPLACIFPFCVTTVINQQIAKDLRNVCNTTVLHTVMARLVCEKSPVSILTRDHVTTLILL